MRIIEGVMVSTLFLGYLGLWKIKRKEMKKQFKIDPEVLASDQRPTQLYFAAMSKLLTMLVVVLIASHVFFSSSNSLMRPYAVFDSFYFDMAGFLIALAGLAICRIAQSTMGDSWRVGIDATAKSGLITNGIYQYIRNPTYTGLFTLCLGVWLIFPTVLFTIWIIVFFLLLEVQVRYEEEYLLEVHGEKYVQYSQGTKRYIPWLY